MIINYPEKVKKNHQGSFFLSPAHGTGGARATTKIMKSRRKNRAKPKSERAKRKGGVGEMNFCPLANTAPKARSGWEAARPCVSKEAKPAKIVSLIEKDFCACLLKDLSIFAGFACRRQAASRWAGSLPCWQASAPVRAQIVAQKKFERRSVIATIIDFLVFEGSLFARSPRLRRGFARIFPYILGLNQRDGQNQKAVFCPAGGGSALRSNAIPQGGISNFFQCRFAALRSQFLFSALYGQGRLIKN